MKKDEALKHWKGLPDNLAILPHFEPIPYKAEGSSYGACGVRIDGSPEFIDAVMSRLKDLIDAENCVTRLELSRKTVEARPGRPLHKAATRAEVCYIRCHQRGREGAILQSFIAGSRARAASRLASDLGCSQPDAGAVLEAAAVSLTRSNWNK